MVDRNGVLSLALGAALAAGGLSGPAHAEDTVKIGLILPMSGVVASTGKQISSAIRLYMKQNGDTVAGRKIEIILKDDGAMPDKTKSAAQELIVNDKVSIIAGFGVTPSALAAAPLATEAKVPAVVMAAGTSIITERSPYIVRTSFTLPQSSSVIGDWAAKNGIKKVATLTSDYAPGNDAVASFKQHFTASGGEIVEEIKLPLVNPDFAPFLQRVKDSKPDAMFVFVPPSQGGNFMKQYAERGLDKAGIKVIGSGEVMDDDLLNGMGDAALGAVTAHIYSAAHPSAMNKDFVAAYKKEFRDRPGFMAVSGYDGIHLIYEALKKTGGDTNGDKLVEAMKGMKWESPRGPVSIDPQTRDIVQNVYIRKVEKTGGELYNVEFQTFEAVKDPGKIAVIAAATPRPIVPSPEPIVRPVEDTVKKPTAILQAPAPVVQAPAPVVQAPVPVVQSDAASMQSHAVPPSGRRVALVIGNSAYRSVPALPNPARDSRVVADTLRKVGFSVTLVNDATREKMVEAIRAFATLADHSDWALIYFAGHGIEIGGQNYLIPVDAKLASDRDVQFETISLEQFMSAAEGASKLRLVLLDACRENPFANAMKRTTASRAVERGFARVEPDAGTLVVYAAKHGQIAQDGDGQNSPFALAFVKRISTPQIEIRKLFDLVRDDVMTATGRQQQPFTYGSVPGAEDFYFLTTEAAGKPK